MTFEKVNVLHFTNITTVNKANSLMYVFIDNLSFESSEKARCNDLIIKSNKTL